MQYACSRLATPVLRIIHTGLGPIPSPEASTQRFAASLFFQNKIISRPFTAPIFGALEWLVGYQVYPLPCHGHAAANLAERSRFGPCEVPSSFYVLSTPRFASFPAANSARTLVDSTWFHSPLHSTFVVCITLRFYCVPKSVPSRQESCSSRATPLPVEYGTAAVSVCWSRYLGRYPSRSRSGCGRCSRSTRELRSLRSPGCPCLPGIRTVTRELRAPPSRRGCGLCLFSEPQSPTCSCTCT